MIISYHIAAIGEATSSNKYFIAKPPELEGRLLFVSFKVYSN